MLITCTPKVSLIEKILFYIFYILCTNECIYICKNTSFKLKRQLPQEIGGEDKWTDNNWTTYLPLELCNRFNQLKEGSSKALNTTGVSINVISWAKGRADDKGIVFCWMLYRLNCTYSLGEAVRHHHLWILLRIKVICKENRVRNCYQTVLWRASVPHKLLPVYKAKEGN